MTITWTAYPNPPWECIGNNRTLYGAELQGDNPTWLVIEKRGSQRHWRVLFVPVAFKPYIAWQLFETRRLAGAKALAELWASSRPEVSS